MKLTKRIQLAVAVLPASALVFICSQRAMAIATQLPNNGLLQSWEGNIDGNDPADGWYVPSWGTYGSNENSTSEAVVTQSLSNPFTTTDGTQALEVDNPNLQNTGIGGFAWTVGWQSFGGSEQNNGAAMLAQFNAASANNYGNYDLSYDVIYKTAYIPASPSSVQFPWIEGYMIFQWQNGGTYSQNNAYSATQLNNIGGSNPAVDSVEHIQIPLTAFDDTINGTTYHMGDDTNLYWVQIYLGVNGSYNPGMMSVFYDNLRISPKILGDVNGDGVVDATDLSTIQTNMNTSVKWGYANGDFNGDGLVNQDDVALYQLGLAEYNATLPPPPAPEPAMLGAAGLVGLAVLRRRR